MSPEPLEISSQNFQGIILQFKGQTSLKTVTVGCTGGEKMYLMFYSLLLPTCGWLLKFGSHAHYGSNRLANLARIVGKSYLVCDRAAHPVCDTNAHSSATQPRSGFS